LTARDPAENLRFTPGRVLIRAVSVRRSERRYKYALLWDTRNSGASTAWAIVSSVDRTLNCNRGIGWDVVQLAIDDHSRVSYVRVQTDERGENRAQFLHEAVTYYGHPRTSLQRA
jgi:hypothetical protein